MTHVTQATAAHTTCAAPSVNTLAETRVEDCYQCGKCTAGCPVAEHMDIMPNQIVRLVQIDQLARALQSQAIWHCVSCQTCSERCPKSVDCAGVLEALRQMAAGREEVAPERRQVLTFYEAFLANIRRNGRLHELDLVGHFKAAVFLQTRNVLFLFKDAMQAPRLMKRGKLHLRAQRVRDRGVVERIFQRCVEEPVPAGGAA